MSEFALIGEGNLECAIGYSTAIFMTKCMTDYAQKNIRTIIIH